MSVVLQTARKLRYSLRKLADIGGRDGLVGQYFVLGNDGRRAAYWSFRSRLKRFERERRSQLAANLPPVGDLAISRDVGFLRLEPGRFSEIPAIVQGTRALVDSIDPEASRRNSKQYLYGGLLDSRTLTIDSPYLRFALREDVVAAVAQYLGELPVLADIDILVSPPSPAQGATSEGSQLFHCDWDDVSQIKVFVYATDVNDVAAGPLTLLDAKSSQYVRDRLDYRYGFTFGARHGLVRHRDVADETANGKAGPVRLRVPDEAMHGLVGAEAAQRHKGAAQTVIFADTSRCFHLGSRVAPGATPRIVTVLQFVTASSFLQPTAARSLRHLASPGLPELQRRVLGAA
jgi:hypothetical protein